VGRRLIFDTSVLVGLERRNIPWEAIAGPDDELAIAAISIAEFQMAAEFMQTETQRQRHQFFWQAVKSQVETLRYTADTAAVHAKLLAHARKQGRQRGTHDLIIAAHAAETGRLLVTTDVKAGFADLPGVQSKILTN
jgi:predicted nucleic acid-binding protein